MRLPQQRDLIRNTQQQVPDILITPTHSNQGPEAGTSYRPGKLLPTSAQQLSTHVHTGASECGWRLLSLQCHSKGAILKHQFALHLIRDSTDRPNYLPQSEHPQETTTSRLGTNAAVSGAGRQASRKRRHCTVPSASSRARSRRSRAPRSARSGSRTLKRGSLAAAASSRRPQALAHPPRATGARLTAGS